MATSLKSLEATKAIVDKYIADVLANTAPGRVRKVSATSITIRRSARLANKDATNTTIHNNGKATTPYGRRKVRKLILHGPVAPGTHVSQGKFHVLPPLPRVGVKALDPLGTNPVPAQDVVMGNGENAREANAEPPASPVDSVHSANTAGSHGTASTSKPPSYVSDSLVFEAQMEKLIQAVGSVSAMVHETGEAAQSMSLEAQREVMSLRDTLGPIIEKLGTLANRSTLTNLDETTQRMASSMANMNNALQTILFRREEAITTNQKAIDSSNAASLYWWLSAELNRISPNAQRSFIPLPTSQTYVGANLVIVPRDVLHSSTEFVTEFVYLFSTLTNIPHDAFSEAYTNAYEKSHPHKITSLGYIASVWVTLVRDCIEHALINYGRSKDSARCIGITYQVLYNYIIHQTSRLLVNKGNLWEGLDVLNSASITLYAALSTLCSQMDLVDWNIDEGSLIVVSTDGGCEHWWPRIITPFVQSNEQLADLELPAAWIRPSFATMSLSYERWWIRFIVSIFDFIDRSVKGAREKTAIRYHSGTVSVPGNWSSRLGSTGLVGSTHAYFYVYYWIYSIIASHKDLTKERTPENIKKIDELFDFLLHLFPVIEKIFVGIFQHDHHQPTWAQVTDLMWLRNIIYTLLVQLSEWLPVHTHWIVHPPTTRNFPSGIAQQMPRVASSYTRNLGRAGLLTPSSSSTTPWTMDEPYYVPPTTTSTFNPSAVEFLPATAFFSNNETSSIATPLVPTPSILVTQSEAENAASSLIDEISHLIAQSEAESVNTAMSNASSSLDSPPPLEPITAPHPTPDPSPQPSPGSPPADFEPIDASRNWDNAQYCYSEAQESEPSNSGCPTTFASLQFPDGKATYSTMEDGEIADDEDIGIFE
ncbi:hypothetical protein DL93DRAFT_2172908 [Clavulina sp. PMI_390]|nr:hypothetical protein DL93DRAFT_2172908 [Clavulina sp. PMI_390]